MFNLFTMAAVAMLVEPTRAAISDTAPGAAWVLTTGAARGNNTVYQVRITAVLRTLPRTLAGGGGYMMLAQARVLTLGLV